MENLDLNGSKIGLEDRTLPLDLTAFGFIKFMKFIDVLSCYLLLIKDFEASDITVIEWRRLRSGLVIWVVKPCRLVRR